MQQTNKKNKKKTKGRIWLITCSLNCVIGCDIITMMEKMEEMQK
jgi:hypothetical protein